MSHAAVISWPAGSASVSGGAPRSTRRILLMLGFAAALAAAGAIASQRWPLATPPATPVPESADHPAGHPAGLWGAAPPSAATSPDDEAPAVGTAAEPAAAVPLSPAPLATMTETLLEIDRHGERLELRFQRASRAEVVRRLAKLTGTQILGSTRALADARPLTLHWQGRDLGEAWRHVLGDELGHVLACAGRNACRVWLLPAAQGPAGA